jgi:hypothetical protein
MLSSALFSISFESDHIVIRNSDGKLFWNSHVVDLKGSYLEECDNSEGGGYKEIFIKGGVLIEKSDYREEIKEFPLV